MRVAATALATALATAADSGGVGLRPVKPYRAWCWSGHPILTDHPDLYAGVNLDLLPGGGSNTTVAQIENAKGMATLGYATGAEEPFDPDDSPDEKEEADHGGHDHGTRAGAAVGLGGGSREVLDGRPWSVWGRLEASLGRLGTCPKKNM